MIKFIKKLFSKKEVLVVPKPKPTHCRIHSRFRKSCSSCIAIVQRGY